MHSDVRRDPRREPDHDSRDDSHFETHRATARIAAGVDAFSARHHWAEMLRAFWRRYASIDGGRLAALIAVNAFLGIAPVVLVVVGFVDESTPAAAFANGVVRNWGVTADAADAVRAAAAGATARPLGALVVAAVSFAWFGLALGDTVRIAFRRAWRQPTERRSGDWIRVTAWYAVVLALLLGGWWSAAILGRLSLAGEIFTSAGSLVLMFGFWIATPRLFLLRDSGTDSGTGTNRLRWRRLVPGAVVCALGFVVAQSFTSALLSPWITEYVGLFGTLGVAFTLLFWWWVIAYLVLAGAVVGAVVDEAHAVTGERSTAKG